MSVPNTLAVVSLLLLYGTSPALQSSIRQSALQCELCDFTATDSEELHSHLLQRHQLQSARWNQSRDTIDGEGQMGQLLMDPAMRLRLTLKCQHCALSYTRSCLMTSSTCPHHMMPSPYRPLLQDALQMMQLSRNCLFCGHRMHPAAMCSHLREVNGMVAALTDPGTCLCLHLDRCCQHPDTQQVYKCEAHTGLDGCGHYRTALRLNPAAASGRAIRWLLCDDWSAPNALWELPDWFNTQVTMLWVVRTDRLDLHLPGPMPADDLTREMLQTMRNQPQYVG